MVRREEVEMTTEELGRGAWGVVKVAKFRGLRVAAKCHQVIISYHNLHQLTCEMSIYSKLRHPNLLLIIGATREGELVILTELMATSLRKELEKKELSREQVISISRDVSCGLNYMHQYKPHPIIHSDISSSHVLLEPLPDGWRAKISGFGSDNFIDDTMTSIPLRRYDPVEYCYIKPYQAISSSHVLLELPTSAPIYIIHKFRMFDSIDLKQNSPKSNMFSFGVLLIEMCLYELPEFMVTEAKRAALIRRIHWPSMVSLIEKCIRKSPEDRPSASDIISLLDRM